MAVTAYAFLLLKKCASTKWSMMVWLARIDRLELDAHADAAVAPGHRPSASMSFFDPGMRKRTLIFAPFSSGLVVRMAMPP